MAKKSLFEKATESAWKTEGLAKGLCFEVNDDPSGSSDESNDSTCCVNGWFDSAVGLLYLERPNANRISLTRGEGIELAVHLTRIFL